MTAAPPMAMPTMAPVLSDDVEVELGGSADEDSCERGFKDVGAEFGEAAEETVDEGVGVGDGDGATYTVPLVQQNSRHINHQTYLKIFHIR